MNIPHEAETARKKWRLTLDAPFASGTTGVSWVAPATTAEGTACVLKLATPHMEGRDEIAGLRFWNGDPTVRLLDADDELGVMLLERCRPGTSLRALPESQQDVVIAGLLRRLWRAAPSQPFRPLSAMLEHWAAETLTQSACWMDEGLVRDGLRLFSELSMNAPAPVLLATDLHAGNVLAAEREPWLVIDPKPFVGDPAYDATQHLLNCVGRLRSDPLGTIRRFADLMEVDAERVRLWTLARLAAEPAGDWDADARRDLARLLGQ